MTESTPEVLEQQIADLQRQLDATRRENGIDTNTPYERVEVHTALGEQIQQQRDRQPQTMAAPSVDVPSYQDPEVAPQVQALVDVAFTKGPQAAIAEALKTHNSALIDNLHDILADELHPELLKRQLIAPAA